MIGISHNSHFPVYKEAIHDVALFVKMSKNFTIIVSYRETKGI